MDKSEMMDFALKKIANELDDIEGSQANSHSLEDCPDPLNCDQHDMENSDNLSGEQEEGSPAAVEVTVHKMGMPSMDGEKEDEGLDSDQLESLKKLLK